MRKKVKDLSQINDLEPVLPKSTILIWTVFLCFLAFFIWAYVFKLEEVSTGTGKVVSSSKEQVIQSLEGGILTKLYVKEGQIVEKGQILAQLDPTRQESTVKESQSLLLASKATVARLNAEVNGKSLSFPDDVRKFPELVKEESALYYSRRANLEESISGLKDALSLVEQELRMTEPLVAKGAASDVEILRLRREANDLRNQMNDIRNKYSVQAREELAKANTDVQTQSQVVVVL